MILSSNPTHLNPLDFVINEIWLLILTYLSSEDIFCFIAVTFIISLANIQSNLFDMNSIEWCIIESI